MRRELGNAGGDPTRDLLLVGQDELPPKLQRLRLHQGYVSSWSAARVARLSSGRLLEHDFTSLLCAADGALEAVLVDFFLDRAGLVRVASERYRLVRGGDLDPALRQRGGRRVAAEPDLFVAVPADAQRQWTPTVAIEVKFGAQVNGRWGYCPAGVEGHPGYSNQIVCYLEGCWLSQSAPSPQYLWMQDLPRPRAFSASQVAGYGLDAVDEAHLHGFLGRQGEAWSRWGHVRHVDLLDHLDAIGPARCTEAGFLAALLRECAVA